MKISELLEALHQWAPAEIAESYDNVGLLIGNPSNEVNRALITLDVTLEVISEAVKLEANVIIAHHPIWFRSRKTLLGDDFTSLVVLEALKCNIAIIAIHTNLDNVVDGVNAKIAHKIGLQDISILQPKKFPPPNQPNQKIGAGMIGYLKNAMPKDYFLEYIQHKFQTKGIRYVDFKMPQYDKNYIHKVAICGGAGSFLIPEVLAQDADAFVTADITYHYYFETLGKCLMMDIGHYESEQFTIELIFEWLSNKFHNFAGQKQFICSQINTNPVQYF